MVLRKHGCTHQRRLKKNISVSPENIGIVDTRR